MLEYVKAAGWGVYPVLLFGLPALAVALRHAVVPAERHVKTVLWLSVLTLLAGVLGMSTGLQIAGQLILAQSQPAWTSIGVALNEAFGNLIISLFLVIATLSLMLLSHLRGPLVPAAERERAAVRDAEEATG